MEEIKVGLIPIKDYLNVLDQRMYCQEYAIDYTKKYYNVDISEYINQTQKEYCFEYSIDIYKRFNNDNPVTSEDNNSREWFNKYGRNRYIKFYRSYKENDGNLYDLIEDRFAISDVIHHIHPLVYGGSNSLLNLIPVTDRFHKILHRNPFEHEEKCCFQAVDYLSYLMRTQKLISIFQEHELQRYDNNRTLLNKMFFTIIEDEMDKFYLHIKEENHDNMACA